MTETLPEYFSILEKELSSIGIRKAESHISNSDTGFELEGNCMYVFCSFCKTCIGHGFTTKGAGKAGFTSFGGNLEFKGVRYAIDSGGQSDYQNICMAHVEGFTVFESDTGVPMAYFSKEKKTLVILFDVSHRLNNSAVSFLKKLIEHIRLIVCGAETLSFGELSNINHDQCMLISERFASLSEEIGKSVKELSAVNTEFVSKTKDIEQSIREEEEKKLKERYDSLITSKVEEKNKEIETLKQSHMNAIVPDFKLLDMLKPNGFFFAILCNKPYIIRRATVTFTHSSAFGLIVRKIEPQCAIDLFIGAEVTNDMKRALSFNAFKEISPVKNIKGMHFMGDYICLGDGTKLLEMPVTELDKSVTDIIALLSNASFDTGIEIGENSRNMFPSSLLKIHDEYFDDENEENDESEDEEGGI